MNIAVILACEACQSRNYKSKKNKTTHPDRFLKKKFCSRCNQRTQHIEVK